MNTILLNGRVLWSFAHEVQQRESLSDFAAQFSFVQPYHKHKGEIALNYGKLLLSGDEDLEISLGSISQIYMGFDDTFPRTLVKNFGLFWQPLVIKLSNGQALYLIIDYTFFGTKNQIWYDALKDLLAN